MTPRAGEDLRRRASRRPLPACSPGPRCQVVTAWNGLALRAFAEAGAPGRAMMYVEIAQNCAGFLLASLCREGACAGVGWGGRRRRSDAFLEDVAFRATASLAVYEATGDESGMSARWDSPGRSRRGFSRSRGRLLATPPRTPSPCSSGPAAWRTTPPRRSGRWRAALPPARRPDRARRAGGRPLGGLGPLVPAIARGSARSGQPSPASVDQLVAPSREVAIVGAADEAATLRLLREVWQRRDPYVLPGAPAVPCPCWPAVSDQRSARRVRSVEGLRLPGSGPRTPGSSTAQLADGGRQGLNNPSAAQEAEGRLSGPVRPGLLAGR